MTVKEFKDFVLWLKNNEQLRYDQLVHMPSDEYGVSDVKIANILGKMKAYDNVLRQLEIVK